jgi:hypothetical protein
MLPSCKGDKKKKVVSKKNIVTSKQTKKSHQRKNMDIKGKVKSFRKKTESIF